MKLSDWLSRIWVKGLLCTAAAAAVTFGLIEFFLPTRMPRDLRGKWVVVDGAVDLKGDTLHIFADGAMIAKKSGASPRPPPRNLLSGENTRDPEADPTTIHGTVRLEGNTLKFTVIHPESGREVTDSQTILDLAEDRLVVEDERGELLIMERQR